MTTSAKSKSSPESTARAGVGQFLSRCFLREIDRAFLAVLQSDEVRPALLRAEPSAEELIARRWEEPDFEAVAVEYCRLFVLPGVCAPLASAWLDRRERERSALAESEVANLSQHLSTALELDLGPDLGALPADHLSVLLAPEGWLEQEAEPGAAREFRAVALDPWWPSFALRLTESTSHPVYRAIGIIAQQF